MTAGDFKLGDYQSFASVASRRYNETGMDKNENPRRHRWPWLVLAVLWIGFEVRKVERERDVNTPLPASPAR
jgi:hypothetical protein